MHKVIRNVTLPLLKIRPNGAPIFVRFESAMHLGKEVKGEEGKKKMEPATLAHVINLETGEECQIICTLLLRERLNEEYPGDGYVGKQFRIVVTREDGKKYNLVGIQEIEWDDDDTIAPMSGELVKADASTGNRPTARHAADAKKGGKRK